MSALATPTLEQPESTVTCRVLVQPHCGTLLQQHSKWTKKWGQDTSHYAKTYRYHTRVPTPVVDLGTSQAS